MPMVNLDSQYEASIKIQSLMHFPLENQEHDKMRRQSDMHLSFSRVIEGKDDDMEFPVSIGSIKELLLMPSSFNTNEQAEKSAKKGIIVGDLLIALYFMNKHDAKEPSFRKAKMVVSDFAKKGVKFKDSKTSNYMSSESSYDDYWAEYKNVAHFWAALRLNDSHPYIADRNLMFRDGGFKKFLQFSATFLDFGTTFKPKRSSQTILNIKTSWLLPTQISPCAIKGEVPQKLLAALKKYSS